MWVSSSLTLYAITHVTPTVIVVVDFSKFVRMYLGEACKAGAPQFENGTTNGAGWYPLTGGMQVCKDKTYFFLYPKQSRHLTASFIR
jgi:hypothetical protein